MQSAQGIILVIDDEAVVRESLAAFLEDRGYRVWQAENGQAGLERLEQGLPDLVLIDLRMPVLDGMAVLKIIHQRFSALPAVILSGTGTLDDAVAALRNGAWDYLIKPVEDLTILLHTVERAIERARLLRENLLYREHLERLVAERTRDAEKATRALRESEAHYRTLADASPDFIYVLDQDGTLQYVNEAGCRLIGRPARELIGTPQEAIFPPEAATRHRAKVEEVIRTRSPITTEEEIPMPEMGGRLWIDVRLVPLFDTEGKIQGVLGISRDITDRRRMEEALRESEARFRGICESAQDGLVMLDPNGRVSYWNPAAETMFGLSSANALGKAFPDILPGVVVPSAASAKTPPVPHQECRLHRADGTEMILEAAISEVPLRGNLHFLCLLRDMTEHRRMEEGLHGARLLAETANRAKDEFLANVSHEIRTPMNAILGFGDLLQESPLNDEQREYLGIINTRGKDLLRIIDDILDLARIEADQLSFFAETFSPARVAEELVRSFQGEARAKNLSLFLEIAPDVPSEVIGDALRLKQVLWNLLGNAIKFTPQGAVRLEVRIGDRNELSTEAPDRIPLHFSLRDTGIGIPQAWQGLIFAPFVQVDGSATRRFGGVGLGLTICRRLMERMGGKIWAESEPGQGSCFHAVVGFLPMLKNHTAGQATVSHPPPPRLSPLKILVAEDDPTSSLLAVSLLQRMGHQTRAVPSGREAVAAVQREAFDLVLMDIQMPDMNGLEATAAIRDGERERGPGTARLPILVVSAHAMQEARDRCLEAGVDGFLTKPFRKNELASLIQMVLAKTPAN